MSVSKKKVSTNKNKLNFEQSLAELDDLVTHMEQGELTLEETLKSFERGIELNKMCQKALDEAEQRVRILTEKEDDKFEVAPFEENDQ
uniref:Exodeoxyribonuclease 7 small subunit n=1 Tax=Candidatus Kentrum sp. TUN TaxID=2126343 RepID=A0A451A6K4_9GAMM|nr:MAG: Exodeoxyribonuclease VII small subunit [Candidatus Kentron sp. TUN]VFK55518.1 MAG: Exodeoxyribonuclease VII small subunit [Candidatus Kentron sp. TUN]VFK61656.1 MAG: Exodeoxyribonuclease VII small subunit [Candidatus Kentron sp. TUN]